MLDLLEQFQNSARPLARLAKEKTAQAIENNTVTNEGALAAGFLLAMTIDDPELASIQAEAIAVLAKWQIQNQ